MLASRQFCLAFILLLYCFSLAFVFLLSWGKTGIRCENSFNITNNLKIIYCTKDKQLWDVTTLSKQLDICVCTYSPTVKRIHTMSTNLFAAMLSAGTSWWCIHQQHLPQLHPARFRHCFTLWVLFLCTIKLLNSVKLSGQSLHLYCFSLISGRWPARTLCLSRRFQVVVWKLHLSQLKCSPPSCPSSKCLFRTVSLENPCPHFSQMKLFIWSSSSCRFKRVSPLNSWPQVSQAILWLISLLVLLCLFMPDSVSVSYWQSLHLKYDLQLGPPSHAGFPEIGVAATSLESRTFHWKFFVWFLLLATHFTMLLKT